MVAGGGGAAGGTGAGSTGGNGGNSGTTPDATGGTAGSATGPGASPGQGGGGGSTSTSTGGADGAAGTVPLCAASNGGPGTGTGTSYALSTMGTANHNGQVIISYTVPSLTIAKTHTRHFTQGRDGTYTITVGNAAGAAPTNGTTVTVHDTLPAGLSADSIRGTGWNCTLNTLTCTRSDVLPAGSSYPPITLKVDVSCRAHAQVTNTATATGGGDTTTHTAPDLTKIKRHKHDERHDHR